MEKLKFHIFITIFFVILLSVSTRSQFCDVEKVEIICSKVATWDYDAVGYVKTCESFKNLKVSTVDASVVYENESEIANIAEIKGFYIDGASAMKFIPTGITQKFKNLKVLRIQWSGLLRVINENLKEFGEFLEYLNLEGNTITSIDSDLLKYNQNLKYISFSANHLRFIAPEFFENLKKLKNVENVRLDGCIDQYYRTSRGHKMSTFTWENEKCTDANAKIHIENLVKSINREKSAQSKCLEETVVRLKAQISDDHKISAENLHAKIDTLTDALQEKHNILKKQVSDDEQSEKKVEAKLNKLAEDFEYKISLLSTQVNEIDRQVSTTLEKVDVSIGKLNAEIKDIRNQIDRPSSVII